MISAVIFDLEGVVIDTEKIWDEEAKLFLEKRGVIYDRDKLKHHMSGKSIIEVSAFLKARFGFSEPVEILAKERRSGFLGLVERDIMFIEGFRDFFDSIRRTKKVAIATAMDPSILKVVDRKIDLSGLFGGNVFSISDVDGKSKPDPAVFRYAAEKIGADPEECVVIEDAPWGIEGAKRAGMRCIALATTYPKNLLAEADAVSSSYEEVFTYLKVLESPDWD